MNKKITIILALLLICSFCFAAKGYAEISAGAKYYSMKALLEEDDDNDKTEPVIIATAAVEGMNFFGNSGFGVYYGFPALNITLGNKEEGVVFDGLNLNIEGGVAYRAYLGNKSALICKLGALFEHEEILTTSANFLLADAHIDYYYAINEKLSIKGGISANVPLLLQVSALGASYKCKVSGIAAGAEIGVAFTY